MDIGRTMRGNKKASRRGLLFGIRGSSVLLLLGLGLRGLGGEGFVDGGSLAELSKRFLERGDVGLVRHEHYGHRVGLEVALEVLDAFLKGDVLLDLRDAALAMEIDIKYYDLLLALGESNSDAHHTEHQQREEFFLHDIKSIKVKESKRGVTAYSTDHKGGLRKGQLHKRVC